MALAFKSAGSVTANPFSADLDPNASTPLVDRVFEIADRTVHGKVSEGFKFFVKYTTPSAGGILLGGTVWVRDEATGDWIQAVAFTNLAELEGVQIANVAPGIAFVQLTAISAGNIASIAFWAAPF